MTDKTAKLLNEDDTSVRSESKAIEDLENALSGETQESQETKGTFLSMMTKPTVPGETKTAMGAAAATFAASLDNASNKLNKSMKKIQANVYDVTDNACGEDEPTKTVINGNKTVDGTDYVSFSDGPRDIPKWQKMTAGGGVACLLLLGLIAVIPGSFLNQALSDAKDNVGRREKMTVGFIGNSYLYVNDAPRVVEAIAKGSIVQQSVINPGASLGRLLRSGNGMYELWATDEARVDINETSYANLVGADYDLFDMGFCTVPQLLEGYDQYLTYKNYNGAYYNNGNNPCFVDAYYLTITNDISTSNPLYFDYVVLNDFTKLIADEYEREDSIEALMYAYAPMLRVAHAVPIIVDTHAFYWEAENVAENETHYGTDVAAFTSQIYAGALEYQAALGSALPEKLEPRIAPIGLAYLTVYEDNRKMYSKLFASDAIHASSYGTYLFATVLYATIYNRMPPSVGRCVDSVFENSRDLLDANMTVFPTVSEANYLRRIAKRVVLGGHKPRSLVIEATEEYEEIVGNETEYDGDGYEMDEEEYEEEGEGEEGEGEGEGEGEEGDEA